MIKFMAINKSGPESWHYSSDYVYINPAEVIAIEPCEHRYHSFREPQRYTRVHLSTGASVEVFTTAECVSASVEEALANGTVVDVPQSDNALERGGGRNG